MKLIMHILKKNKDFNYDTATLDDVSKKLIEEVAEVLIEIANFSTTPKISLLRKVVAETFDVVQVCIGILYICHRIAKNKGKNEFIQEANIRHKDKLIERGWQIRTGIEVDVKE